jgi:magnesium-transporting ATPase (P-type)
MDQTNGPQFTNRDASLPTSTLAIISLVAGILGFTVFPVVATAVAIITGHMARKETRATPPTASGDGMASAGIIMGWIQVGLIAIGICCLAAYFVFIVGAVATSQG